MKRILGFIVISILLINACGPTLESSQKTWNSNLKAIKQLKSEYPVFTPFIDQKLADAKKVWDEVQGISEEEVKLDKMVEANRILSGGSIGNLRNMKSKIKELKREEENILKQQIDSTLKDKANTARTNARLAIQKAESVLAMSQAEFDLSSVSSKIDLAYSGLEDAKREVSIVAGLIKEVNDKIQAEKNKKELDIKAQQEKEEKAKADIKCEYCGTMNKFDRTKCKSCGAPLPKKQ
ncbi:MAG: hypothetical protein L3J74_05725 [Bacteroidales bacterium]|nr:hypothetical protein [Bacteroidales bacterium]